MKYQQNLVVIGAGAGGLVSAYIASAVKSNVTLIEASFMGGDCLNYGCVPSKTLIHIAQQVKESIDVYNQGIVKQPPDIDVDFKQVMNKVKQAIAQIHPKDSVERYRSLGVNVIKGRAIIMSPNSVKVVDVDGEGGEKGEQIITCKKIIIATGARPRIVEIKGLDSKYIYTSENIWKIETLPKKMLIIGSGSIACELGQAFNRLGSKVSILARSSRILCKEDKDASTVIDQTLVDEGVKIYKQCKNIQANNNLITFKANDIEHILEFDTVLMAAGKTGNSQNLGLDNTNIQTDGQNYITVNDYNQTSQKSIYAVGDITGGLQYTHTAAHAAWYSTINSLFGSFKRFKQNNNNIPFAIFTQPQLAKIGLSEKQIIERNIKFDCTVLPINENDKMVCNQQQNGLIKLWSEKGTDKVLGVVIVGDQASELMPQWVWLMKQKQGLNTMLAMPHIYPSYNEINKAIAGKWKLKQTQNPKTQFILSIVKWMFDFSIK
ncbi:MAG: NAD(P)/FAD-dependent oxidoreductase [Pseudomonadales bacterium]|nr:NAD(P)/FAD-dependent oxidoreductase [Pseudomonadales bacterium]